MGRSAVCRCLGVIMAVVIAASAWGDSTKAIVKLRSFGAARVEPEDYAGRILSGVLVEIEVPHGPVTATYDATTVTVRTNNGTKIPVHWVFMTEMSIESAFLKAGGLMEGLRIFIGDQEFQCFGQPAQMALLVSEGGLTIEFGNNGRLSLGLIFLVDPAEIESLSIMEQTIPLGDL